MVRSVGRSMLLSAPVALAFGLLLSGSPWTMATIEGQSSGQPSTARGEWWHYTADLSGSRYSPLDQINGSNFNKLEIAWRFKTDSLGPFQEYKLEGTPLMIGDTLYTTGGTRRSVVALDARTGELKWVHSLREGKRAAMSPRQLSGRGVLVLDRRSRRQPRRLRHHRLSSRRTECRHWAAGRLVRAERRPRHQTGRGLRQRVADQSGVGRDRHPRDADHRR